jgi:hypothetical protein
MQSCEPQAKVKAGYSIDDKSSAAEIQAFGPD